MIRKENPQMLIGYNVFSFDWSYIIDRAEELHCKDDIMRELSINTEEEAKVKKSTTKVASGTHDLTYIKMKGRLQLDLYNHFRKTENLSSYKLDSVASEFISDKVKDYEWIEEKKLEYVNGYHLFFSIWAMTQHYADFDIQVKSILNQSEEELFDDADEYLTSVLLRTLSVRAP